MKTNTTPSHLRRCNHCGQPARKGDPLSISHSRRYGTHAYHLTCQPNWAKTGQAGFTLQTLIVTAALVFAATLASLLLASAHSNATEDISAPALTRCEWSDGRMTVRSLPGYPETCRPVCWTIQTQPTSPEPIRYAQEPARVPVVAHPQHNWIPIGCAGPPVYCLWIERPTILGPDGERLPDPNRNDQCKGRLPSEM